MLSFGYVLEHNHCCLQNYKIMTTFPNFKTKNVNINEKRHEKTADSPI